MDWSNLPEDYERLGTQRAVAAEYGCAQQTVSKAMKRLGIQLPTTTTGRSFAWTEERRANHKKAVNTPQFKASHRASLLNRFDQLRGRSKNSPLEALLHAALNRAGVSYTTQRKKLDKYIVDIELLQAPVIIEADGLLHRLERRQTQDRLRDAELRDMGYHVFRFPGTQINANADACIQSVMQTVGIVPDAAPIADIRRQGSGSDNTNWRGGKYPLTCQHCHAAFESYRKEAKYCNMKCYAAARNERNQVVV